MAAVTTSNPSDYSYRLQTYYNPKLLEALQYSLKLAGYGLSEGYSTIGYTIRFFRPRKANLSGINAEAARTTRLTKITLASTPTSLTEGTTPTGLTEVAIGHKDIVLYQQGGLATITDKLQAIDLLNTVKVYTKTMGEDAALDYDRVIRDSLINGLGDSDAGYTGSNFPKGGYFERFAGVVNTGDSSADYNTLQGLSKANGKITRGIALGVVTQLKTSLVPTIGGNYVCVTPPATIHDIRQDETWVKAATRVDTQNLYKDLEIMLDGVAYVKADSPWVEGAAYLTESSTDPGNGLVYTNIYLGRDAFGIPNLTNKRAGGTQSAPKIVILDQADKYDPLNQKTCIGWKSFFGADPFIANDDATSYDMPRYALLRNKSTWQ